MKLVCHFKRAHRPRAGADAGVALVARDLSVYLCDGASEQLLATAEKPNRLWYETWLALADRFPALANPR
jgi:hypothetical protein